MDINYVIRMFEEDDDFDVFDRMVWDEHLRRSARIGSKWGSGYTLDTSQKMVRKENYFPDSDNPSLISKLSKGFVFEVNKQLAAVATITLHQSGNGHLHLFGRAADSVLDLTPLVDACADYVRSNGGSKLLLFTDILPGQLYNSELDFWANYAFKPEPYYSQWLVFQDFNAWVAPADLNTDQIVTANEMDLSEIVQILEQDGEQLIAESLRYDYEQLSQKTRKSWGSSNGSREALEKRNMEIQYLYQQHQVAISELAIRFGLSEERIRSILYDRS